MEFPGITLGVDLLVPQAKAAIFWSIWPLSGLYGLYKVLIGGDYLLRPEFRRLSKKKSVG